MATSTRGKTGGSRATGKRGAASKTKTRAASKTRATKPTARRATGGKTTARSNRSSRSAGESQTTTDHDQIRAWVEERGGYPAAVVGTGDSSEAGVLRIDYPGFSGAGTLERITWEDFFDKFDEAKLAFLYQNETASGEPSRFSKLVSRTGTRESSRRSR